MHTGNHYKITEFLVWTRRDIYVLFGLAVVPTVLYQWIGLHWIAIPWVPIAMIGTAAAFIVGFKNTQTYNRLWEARQIWGAIVNASRSWGIMTRDFVQTDRLIHRQLIYRHLAWLTAFRFQLRKPQPWENSTKPYNKEYRNYYRIPEWEDRLEDELKKYLPPEELEYLLNKKNRATQLIALQSDHLKRLKQSNQIDALEYIELEKMLTVLYEQQGKCERIKNFPYPRQFASINLFFTWLFVILLPLGMLNEFQKLGEDFVWLTIPFSVVVSWVFTSMEKVGEATENPFEGGANDIPMAALCRTIEIDLRDMLDETELPSPLTPVNNILM
ncbi:MAG: bestrophin family ion channel [Saprospiraceae bacterium]|nr:bestrophin family ion channel [Saprospiraceae bacterium]